MSMLLPALEALAGASDEDRPAWLGERREGVTATEVRDLMIHKVAKRTLIDRKLGRKPESDWTGPYAMWGREREPLIAAEAERRWNIRPERRLFHAADEPRFMCSPDGVGVNFDEEVQGGEYKTSEEDLSPWGERFKKLGYDLQCQWCMRVTGARRWLFMWEERFGQPGDFWAGERHFHWIERDEAVIEQMERVARGFLRDLDEAAREPWVMPPGVDEELDTHAVNYLRFIRERNEAAEAAAAEYAAIKAAARSQVSPLTRITYNPGSPGEVDVVDVTAARAANEDLYLQMQAAAEAWAEHCKKFTKKVPVPAKPVLRVTPVRVEMEKEA